MKKLEWFDNLQKMNDTQLQQFAAKRALQLTLEEIKKLRKIMRHANISWAIAGIPDEVLQNIYKLLGRERYQHLMKLIGL